jgi:hypothetical protein
MGGRAVEGTGLENRQRWKPFVGSNPTPSARSLALNHFASFNTYMPHAPITDTDQNQVDQNKTAEVVSIDEFWTLVNGKKTFMDVENR